MQGQTTKESASACVFLSKSRILEIRSSEPETKYEMCEIMRNNINVKHSTKPKGTRITSSFCG